MKPALPRDFISKVSLEETNKYNMQMMHMSNGDWTEAQMGKYRLRSGQYS